MCDQCPSASVSSAVFVAPMEPESLVVGSQKYNGTLQPSDKVFEQVHVVERRGKASYWRVFKTVLKAKPGCKVQLCYLPSWTQQAGAQS